MSLKVGDKVEVVNIFGERIVEGVLYNINDYREEGMTHAVLIRDYDEILFFSERELKLIGDEDADSSEADFTHVKCLRDIRDDSGIYFKKDKIYKILELNRERNVMEIESEKDYRFAETPSLHTRIDSDFFELMIG